MYSQNNLKTHTTAKKAVVSNSTIEKQVLESFNLGTIGKIRISKICMDIIQYLHTNVGAIEWSGMLFTKLVEGEIDKMENLVFEATFIYPMNIGSSAYTEINYNGSASEAYDIFPEAIEQNLHLVHSHHNMGAFFSSTDVSELISNAPLYNFYISLIVDFKRTFAAKIAFPASSLVERTFELIDGDGKIFIKKSKIEGKKEILIGDLEIEYPKELENISWLKDRFTKLKISKFNNVTTGFNTLFPSERNSVGYDEWGISDNSNSYLKKDVKKISEKKEVKRNESLTEKECKLGNYVLTDWSSIEAIDESGTLQIFNIATLFEKFRDFTNKIKSNTLYKKQFVEEFESKTYSCFFEVYGEDIEETIEEEEQLLVEFSSKFINFLTRNFGDSAYYKESIDLLTKLMF